MEFKCSVCNYTNGLKSCVKTHINKKKKCGESDSDPQIIEIPIKIQCEHCDKTYKTKPSLKRHLKTCKVLKANKDAEINELKTKLAVAEAKLAAKPTIDIKPINKKLSVENKSKIRSLSRQKYKKTNFNMVCLHCEHDRGIQVCHIKELKDFEIGEEIDEINHISNIISLCSNCHYDLDKEKSPGVLRTVEIYQRIINNTLCSIK